ncbi:hypothetical protein CspHIS471_0501620 [Cutaneotrichosporon sp. HIS471]|nr:hypothetical protein CspHIS471_0501620 [Cutaneotrichosporon sp. HIS471]
MFFARHTNRILSKAARYTHSLSVFSSSRLIGKTALITGASSGIGAATAELFARAGANVVILARRQALLDEVKKKCKDAHEAFGFRDAKVVAFEMDMTDSKAIDGILDKTGGLPVDILVNNAGLVRGREQIGDISAEDINVMFQTNVIGLFHLTQVMVRDFKKRNTGFIVNLGSVAGIESYAGGSIYCATKHAVHAFSATLMRELVNTDIRVAEIMPGMVETEFSVYKGLTPLTGEDVAEEIVWVASRPEHVQIAQILMFPSAQASATVNYRKPE